MEQSTAATVVNVVAILYWVGAAFMLFGVLGMLALGGSGGFGMMGDLGMPSAMLGAIGTFVAVIMLAFGLLYVFVGLGLWKRQPWSRIAAVVLGVLSLFSFPIGTILGAVEIWLFGFDDSVKGLFGAGKK